MTEEGKAISRAWRKQYAHEYAKSLRLAHKREQRENAQQKHGCEGLGWLLTTILGGGFLACLFG